MYDPTKEVIDSSIDEGYQLCEEVLSAVLERENLEPYECDSAAVMFALWCGVGRFLTECGWSANQLSKEIASFEINGTVH